MKKFLKSIYRHTREMLLSRRKIATNRSMMRSIIDSVKIADAQTTSLKQLQNSTAIFFCCFQKLRFHSSPDHYEWYVEFLLYALVLARKIEEKICDTCRVRDVLFWRSSVPHPARKMVKNKWTTVTFYLDDKKPTSFVQYPDEEFLEAIWYTLWELLTSVTCINSRREIEYHNACFRAARKNPNMWWRSLSTA